MELGDHIVELVETVLELVRFQPTAITTGSIQRAVDAIQKPPSRSLRDKTQCFAVIIINVVRKWYVVFPSLDTTTRKFEFCNTITILHGLAVTSV